MIKYWMMAIRPKTLFAAASPVLLGISFATTHSPLSWPVALATLTCALLLQISSNLVNDYYDGINKKDDEDRLGPTRVTAEGLLPPYKVKFAFLLTLGLSLSIGLYLMILGGGPIVFIGISSLLFAWAYTGGPYPLSYYGLGELFAFIYFGPVAVWGSAYLQNPNIGWPAFFLGFGPGFITAAIMAINNLRDIKGDAKNQKNTLAVKLGEKKARRFVILLIFSSLLSLFLFNLFHQSYLAMFAILSILVWKKEIRKILIGPIDSQLNLSLANTGKLLFIYCLLWSIAMRF